MSISTIQLANHLKQFLMTDDYHDYGPNGLQVEGKAEINKMAFAVSATQESIQKAIDWQADALVVHHGLFWNFHGVRTITGPFGKRLKALINSGINLFGYHLPLDGHQEVGNAASLAKKMGLKNLAPFGLYKKMPTGIKGEIETIDSNQLGKELEKILDHQIIHSEASSKKIKQIGIITGGANSGWKDAVALDLDAYITGEISEHDWHDAKEAGIHMYAGGHNATEQFGIQNLKNYLDEKFKIESIYFASDNPA